MRLAWDCRNEDGVVLTRPNWSAYITKEEQSTCIITNLWSRSRGTPWLSQGVRRQLRMFLAEKCFCFWELPTHRCSLSSWSGLSLSVAETHSASPATRFSVLCRGSGRNKNKPSAWKIVLEYKHYKYIMESHIYCFEGIKTNGDRFFCKWEIISLSLI